MVPVGCGLEAHEKCLRAGVLPTLDAFFGDVSGRRSGTP
jgi:hypothetical protein